MRKGKREMSRKAPAALVAVIVLLCCTVGGTLAYLIAKTDAVTNTFTPAQVECKVDDKYENNQKTDITVENPQKPENVDAYIRVAIVPTWEDKDGNVAAKKAELDYPAPANGWFKVGNYWYYPEIVNVGESTKTLFNEAIQVPRAEGAYTMNVQVLAEAIQAYPDEAVSEAWPDVRVGTNGLEKAG